MTMNRRCTLKTDDETGKVRSSVFPFMDLLTSLMLNIFFLLPINDIIQCNRVCKTWNHLISTYFSANYTRNSPFVSLWLIPKYSWRKGDTTLIQVSEKGECVRSPIDIVDKRCHTTRSRYEDMSIIGSCNGITCVLLEMTEYKVSSDEFYYSSQIYLFSGISSPLIGPKFSYFGSGKILAYQFGFSPSANKFKVIRFIEDDKSDHEIFTVGEDSDWRILPRDSVQVPLETTSRLFGFLTFNGVVHWVDRPRRIASTFDLGEEKGGRISLPFPFKEMALKQLKVLNDCLSLIDYYHECESGITIWTMKEYPIHQSWTKEYVISVSSIRELPLTLVALLPNGDILFSFECSDHPPMCYNPRQKKWTDFDIGSDVDFGLYRFSVDHTQDINLELFVE